MRKKHGFTLIELMVTLAVVAIVVIMGLPQLRQLTSGNRLVSQINNLAADLALARSEAVKRGLPVTLTADSASSWTSGWTVAVNASAELRKTPALSGTSELTGTSQTLRYNPDGALNSTGFTYTLCDTSQSGSEVRQITISATGRPRLSRGPATCP